MSGLPHKAKDRLNTVGIVVVGLSTASLLWASVIGLQAFYYNTAGDLESQRNAINKGREMRDLKAQQRADLDDSKYIDPQKGTVTLPIDSAMDLVVRDINGMAPSLVPSVGTHDVPTIPASWGRPSDTAAVPAPTEGGEAAPSSGDAATAPTATGTETADAAAGAAAGTATGGTASAAPADASGRAPGATIAPASAPSGDATVPAADAASRKPAKRVKRPKGAAPSPGSGTP